MIFFCDFVFGTADERCKEQCPTCVGHEKHPAPKSLADYWMRRAEISEHNSNGKDAARYRWIRQCANDDLEYRNMSEADQAAWNALLEGISPDALDESIDKAIRRVDRGSA